MTPICDLLNIIAGCLLALSLWAAPQPVFSEGKLLIYGDDRLTAANAEYHGYSLDGYKGGASGISPSMLGRIAWYRVEHGDWLGPYLIIDAAAQNHAAESIWVRHEISEITWATAAELGFSNGGVWGYAFFGVCPPDEDSLNYQPSRYAPDPEHVAEYTGRRSFAPYPEQQTPTDCP